MANAIGPVQVSDRVLLIGGGVLVLLVLGGLWYLKKKVTDTAEDAVDYLKNDAVNVTSGNNLPSLAVNTVGQAVGIFGTNDFTGQPNTLGSALEEGGRKISNAAESFFGGFW